MNPTVRSILYSLVPPKMRGNVLLIIAVAVLLWNYYPQHTALEQKIEKYLGMNIAPTISPTAVPTSLPSSVLIKSISAVPSTAAQKDSLEPQTIPAAGIPADAEQVKVKKVVDGDTIDVILSSGKSSTIRLIGINSPESVDPRKPVECFGKEASQYAKNLMKKGDTVYLKADPTQDDKDKYDRLLRYVWLTDGTSVNEKMVTDGFAYEFTYDVPYIYQSEYKKAQSHAESAKLGLWADSTCKGVK
jgi:micrococcal nuclease